FFQAEDGIRGFHVTGVQTCALPIFLFYVVGVLLLLVLDAILIVTIIDERAPAFALSLLIVALAWLPLRDMLARIVLRRAEPSREIGRASWRERGSVSGRGGAL